MFVDVPLTLLELYIIALLEFGVQGFWLPHILDTIACRNDTSRGGAGEAMANKYAAQYSRSLS